MHPYEHLIAPESLARTPRATPPPADVLPTAMQSLEQRLRATVDGEVRFEAASRALYALDASNYRQFPIGVVIPRTPEAVVAAVGVCREYGAPIVSRAGGTGLAGQTVNEAVVIDFSKYVNRILSIDSIDRRAVVEPGVICDEVVHAGKPHHLTWSAQPATHDHCCFGGMLGNNACGTHAQMGGKAVDNTEAMRVLLYDGTVMDVGWMTDADLQAAMKRSGREGQVYRSLEDLRSRWRQRIEEKFPKLPRRVSGYNLDQLLPGPDGRFNVARALVGSEGTLVTILQATVRLIWNHPERVLAVVGYSDVYSAADRVPDVLPFGPTALEGMDHVLVRNVAAKGGLHARAMRLLPKGNGFLLVEFGDATQEAALAQARRMVEKLQQAIVPPVDLAIVTDQATQHKLWAVREAGLGATAFVPGQRDTWPGWEDSAVRPELLGRYLRDLRQLYDRYGYEPALYGHFGMGCVHSRVQFDLYTAEGVAKFRSFMVEAAQLVTRYDGSLSGEHGDGQSRAELLPIMFGEEMVQAFREFKAIWDPDGKMNPGKVVDPYSITSNLRLGPEYHPTDPQTYFAYPDDDGSFARATLRCVGIGNCRRLSGESTPEKDVMCPSFMVTREERHSTRGRAHLLHEMLVQNTPIDGGWRDESVKEALDLCLSCKGCKGDCPVNVDMATYKAEFFAHYYQRRMRPRSAYAFGYVDQWARIAAWVPGLANLITQTPGLSAVAKAVAGISQERSLPPFAPQTFRDWFVRHRRTHRASEVSRGREKVVLWADTFNNYFHPEVARAAVHVLEKAGFEVLLPEGHLCCGRPLYDFGMLASARRYLERVLLTMAPHIDSRTPVVVLEPSCASVFRDELRSLFPGRSDAERLRTQTVLLSEFLISKGAAYTPPTIRRKALVQGHCHHKSVLRFDDEKELLKKVGLDVEVVPSGCCGMAGSFGFERGEKHDVSIAEGERVLLPAVRNAEPSTLVVANGFSCKTQIAQGTPRGALHIAEVLAMGLDAQASEPRAQTIPVEEHVLRSRRDEVRRSMFRAAALLGAGTLTALLATRWRRGRRRVLRIWS